MTITAPQERLFAPPREPEWCPMRNCAKRCGPHDCSCPKEIIQLPVAEDAEAICALT